MALPPKSMIPVWPSQHTPLVMFAGALRVDGQRESWAYLVCMILTSKLLFQQETSTLGPGLFCCAGHSQCVSFVKSFNVPLLVSALFVSISEGRQQDRQSCNG